MDYNRRIDFRGPRESALGWWKTLPMESLLIRTMGPNGRNIAPQEMEDSVGPWVILSRQESLLAAVASQKLEDRTNDWGVALLWFDAHKCSRLSRFFHAGKLRLSWKAALAIEEHLRHLGCRLFNPEDSIAFQR